MNDSERERIKHSLNTETVRRSLIRYFIEKGFTDSFDKSVCPCDIQDLPYATPGLHEKIEIVPYTVNVDPTIGRATIGWNLFILGNQRMFLGETTHENLSELARQINQGSISKSLTANSRLGTTPRRIIAFINKILSTHDEGYVDLQNTPQNRGIRPPAGAALANSQNSKWYTRAGYN